jgi:hypothetical protein
MHRVPAGLGLAALCLALAPRTATAQTHAHASDATEKLGTVHFPTSCSPAVSTPFDRAVTLLHSFEFGLSIRAFDDVLAADSTCAMAEWGVALSRWSNPMAQLNRAAPQLRPGRLAAENAVRLGSRATEREQMYIAAVAELYRDFEHVDQRTRVAAYERRMNALSQHEPADTEAMIFHALSLTASALPTDKTYGNQLKAAAILEPLYAAHPDHPGLAHYLIHTYDVPALASRATSAAQRYASIAPSAAHALHMPSHTFTRVGKWEESVRTNDRSIAIATRDGMIAEALHGLDYKEYALLQMHRDSAAKAVVLSLPALAARFDPEAITGAAPGSSGVFALAAIPARYALERQAWKEAAALAPKSSAFPWTEAMTYFARAIGASHVGQPAIARVAIDSLRAIRDRLNTAGETYWSEQVAIQHLCAQAWMQAAALHNDDALTIMREAVNREDATEKSATTPGPLLPARELLGDMLLQFGRTTDALAEYRATLIKEPNRYRALHGARRAATAAGDGTAAALYAAQLKTLTNGRR